MLSYAERTSRIAADAAEVPATFGLRGFRGDVFRVNLASSYVVEIDYPQSPTGKAYKLELLGCLVVPAGSPMLTIERLLGGTIS